MNDVCLGEYSQLSWEHLTRVAELPLGDEFERAWALLTKKAHPFCVSCAEHALRDVAVAPSRRVEAATLGVVEAALRVLLLELRAGRVDGGTTVEDVLCQRVTKCIRQLSDWHEEDAMRAADRRRRVARAALDIFASLGRPPTVAEVIERANSRGREGSSVTEVDVALLPLLLDMGDPHLLPLEFLTAEPPTSAPRGASWIERVRAVVDQVLPA